MKKLTAVAIIIVLSPIGSAIAQCAMCRATVETNVANGDIALGAGLNFGIMYLFMAPYLLFMTMAYLWYRNARSDKKLSLLDLIKRKNLKI